MVAALATVMCAATAFSVAKTNVTKAAGETTTKTLVQYELSNDTVTVQKEITQDSNRNYENYLFYTTDNASRKVPAANKWTRVKNGTVDCSKLTSGKTLYFAMTTTPTLADIVAVKIPAQPKITKATYKAAEKKWEIKIGKTDVTEKAEKPESSEIESKQLTGGEVEVYVRAYAEKDKQIGDKLSDNDSVGSLISLSQPAEKTVFEFPEGAARRSNNKIVKIAKRAMGPSVTVDWANHYVKVGKEVEAQTVSSIDKESKYDNPLTVENGTGYNGYFFGDAAKIYNIRTAKTETRLASLDTVVSVPATLSFGDDAKIIGGFEQDALLEIKPQGGKAANGTTISYQYVKLDKATFDAVVKEKENRNGHYYDYRVGMDKNIKWSTIKYKVDSKGKETIATAKIVNSKKKKLAEGSVILVRKAATTGVPSSKVMIFKMPTSTDNYWKSKPIDAKDDQYAGQLSVKEITRDNEKIEIIVKNGGSLITSDTANEFNKDKITLNRKAADVAFAKTGTDGADAKITITIPENLKTNKITLSIALNKGFINGSTYSTSFSFADADLVAPKLVSDTVSPNWSISDDKKTATAKFKVEISENLASKGSDGAYTLLANGSVADYFEINDNYMIKNATYSKKTTTKKAKIEFEVTYDLAAAAPANGELLYKLIKEGESARVSLYDAKGNALVFKEGKIVIPKNDSYTMWKEEPEEEQGESAA